MEQCHPLQPVPHSQPDQWSSIDSICQPTFDGCSEADYASATSMIALADGGVVADFSDSNSEDISLGSSANSLRGRKSWDSEYDTFASEDEEEEDNGIKHNNEDNDIMRANLSKTLDDKSALGSDVEYVSCSSSIVDLDEEVIDSPSHDLGPKCSNNVEIESLGSSTGSLALSTVKHEANWDSEYDTFASDNDEDDDGDNDFMKPEPSRPADEPFLKSPDSVDYVSGSSSMHGLDEKIKDPPLKFDTSLSSSEHLLLRSSKDARGQVVFRDESDSEYDTFESEDDDDNNNNNNNNNYDIMEPEFPRTKEDLYLQSIFENFVRFGTLPRVKRKTRDVKTSETIFNAQGITYPTFPRKWTYGTLPRPRPKARSTIQPSTFSTFGTYSKSHSMMLNVEPVLNRNLDSIPEEIGSPVYGLALTSDAMAKHGIKELFERSHSTIPRSFQGSVKRARDVNDWNKFG